jgi:hypothetical protein
MLKPENNPYLKKYMGPPMCFCCNTLLAIKSKDLCHSCQCLDTKEHALVHQLVDPSTPLRNKSVIQETLLTPEILQWYDSEFEIASVEARRTRSAKAVLAGETPSPHPNYNWPVASSTPPPATTDLPTTLAPCPVVPPVTQGPSVTKLAPPVGTSAGPPLFQISLQSSISLASFGHAGFSYEKSSSKTSSQHKKTPMVPSPGLSLLPSTTVSLSTLAYSSSCTSWCHHTPPRASISWWQR